MALSNFNCTGCVDGCLSYLSKRAWVRSNGRWAGRFVRTRPSVAGHPCSCSAPWRQRWTCPHSALHWEEIQDARSPPLSTTEKSEKISGSAKTPSEHIHKLNKIVIKHKRLETKLHFTFNYIFVLVDLNEYGVNSASCKNGLISTFWKFLPFLILDLTVSNLNTPKPIRLD